MIVKLIVLACSCAKYADMKKSSLFFKNPLARMGAEMIYYAPVRPERATSIFENRELEIKENCNVNEIGELMKEVSC